MPQPDEQTRDVIVQWLTYARSDLAVATGPRVDEALPALYAFHAQQAAEKALKAVLILHGIDPPRTHNIRELYLRVELDTPERLPAHLHDAAHVLTQYAVDSRYPDAFGDVPAAEAEAAGHTAAEIVMWATERIGAD